MKRTTNGGRDRLTRLLRITGLTAGKLAKLGGIANPNLYLYLAGTRGGFSPATWDAIAQVFGVSVDWLAFGRGAAPDDADVLRAVARRRDAAA